MDFIFSTVAIAILGALFAATVKKMQSRIKFEISKLIQQFRDFFILCERQYVTPSEWTASDDNLAKCFENYFDGDSEEILKEPLLKYFETLKKSSDKLRNFLDLVLFRFSGVFIIVLILRIGLAIAATQETEWNFVFSLCVSFLAALAMLGLIVWIESHLQKLLDSKDIISQILCVREDESLLLSVCMSGEPREVHVKIKQDAVINENNFNFRKAFARFEDVMPIWLFLFFCLLSFCFLFYPTLNLLQDPLMNEHVYDGRF